MTAYMGLPIVTVPNLIDHHCGQLLVLKKERAQGEVWLSYSSGHQE